MSGLSKEELSPELCPDEILSTKVPRLCKDGNDSFINGFGCLVFLRADAKDPSLTDEAWLNSANKKFMQYNDDVSFLLFTNSGKILVGHKVNQCLNG